MRWVTRVLAVLGLVLGATGQAGAVAITVVNPGFEVPPELDGTFTTTPNAATGWTHDGTAGVWNPSPTQAYGGVAPEGSNVAYSNSGPLSQILTTLLAANTTYTLTVQVGDRGDTAFPGYQVQLLAGSTVLAQCNTCVTPADNTFTLATVTFTTPSSVTTDLLGIRLDSNGEQTNFDDVRLNASPADPVPEPGTLFLFGAGLAGIGVLRGRRWFKGAGD